MCWIRRERRQGSKRIYLFITATTSEQQRPIYVQHTSGGMVVDQHHRKLVYGRELICGHIVKENKWRDINSQLLHQHCRILPGKKIVSPTLKQGEHDRIPVIFQVSVRASAVISRYVVSIHESTHNRVQVTWFIARYHTQLWGMFLQWSESNTNSFTMVILYVAWCIHCFTGNQSTIMQANVIEIWSKKFIYFYH